MPVKSEPGYSIEDAETDIADIRDQVGNLGEYFQATTIDVQGQVFAAPGGTEETWHAFNPLSNSWAVPTNGYAQYRLTPMNELQISAWITSPQSSTVNGVTIATFPSGYRPLSTHGFPVACDLMESSYVPGNGSPSMTITSGGVLQSFGCGGGSGTKANIYFEVKIPLDV